jgi:hypothetical protein
MPSDDQKTLPKDIDSDFSLPGRSEESNSTHFDAPPEKPKPKSRGLYVMVIALMIVASGFFSYYFMNQNEIDSQIIQNTLIVDPEKKLIAQYGVGSYGSEHSHGVIVIFVNGEQLNFDQPQFQLASRYIHFENHNSYLLHKHATGAPMEMFFTSLGIKITPDCMELNYFVEINSDRFCSDQNQSLRFFVNGKPYHSDLSQYVFEKNDRILVSFGDVKSITEQIKYLDSLKFFDVPEKAPQYSGDGITI